MIFLAAETPNPGENPLRSTASRAPMQSNQSLRKLPVIVHYAKHLRGKRGSYWRRKLLPFLYLPHYRGSGLRCVIYASQLP